MSEIVDDQRIGEIGWAPDPTPRPEPLPDAFGSALRLLRERRGLNQKQLAERAAVTPSSITRLEHGDRGPSQESIKRLADAVGASPEEYNHLLGTAGFLTEQAVTLLDEPELVRLSAVLADPRLTADDRRMLLTYVSLAVAHAESRGYGIDGPPAPREQAGPRRAAGAARRPLQRERARPGRSAS